MADRRYLEQGPELKPRNYLADWAREYGFNTLSNRLNDPQSGIGLAADLIGGLGNALVVQPAQSFNRLMTEGYRSGDPQSAEDAFNVAGAAMVGGLAAPKPAANAVGIFGGRLAKTADQAKLAQAEKMAAEGAPREQIWSQTGWFQGPDKKWRFEIDDSNSVVYPGYLEQTGKSEHAAPFRDRMSHSGYLQAYPEAEQLNVQRISNDMAQSRGFNGTYYRDRGIAFNGSTPDRGRSVALHELQHDAQAREGFAYGGDPRQFETKPQVGSGGTGRRFNWSGDSPVDSYRRLAGEVEARTVQARRDLTPEQRAARPPWLDYDVPERDQIVRFADGTSLNANGGRPGAAVGVAANAEPQDNRQLKSSLDKYGLGHLLQPTDWARKMQPGDA